MYTQELATSLYEQITKMIYRAIEENKQNKSNDLKQYEKDLRDLKNCYYEHNRLIQSLEAYENTPIQTAQANKKQIKCSILIDKMVNIYKKY